MVITILLLLRSKNIRSSLSFMPTPPNFRELAHSSALAARMNKVDSNGHALLNFEILAA
jgi:hypothetical protein